MVVILSKVKALLVTEEFTERYTNIAISGLNYTFFAFEKLPPFYLNHHVYSTLLILNDIPYRWRGRYNEDTDLCLQVLSGNWCTILLNAFTIDKMTTMTMKGGNTDILYKGDGRLVMANSLKRLWPNVVDVKRRFKRPQHRIRNEWKNFDTLLIKKKGLKIEQKPNEYGLQLVQKKPIKSKSLQEFFKNNI